MIFKTRAIILKRYKIGEADRLLLAFSEEFGKILVKAKAVRKPQSKLAGHIEPYKLIDIEIVRGKGDFYCLVGAKDDQIKKDYPIEVLRNLEILGETIDLALGEGESNRQVFQDFAMAINLIVQNPKNFQLIAAEGLVKILGGIGFKPELERCVICQEPIVDERNGWSSISGGAVCQNCLSKKLDTKLLSSNTILTFLRILQREQNAASRMIIKNKEIIAEAEKLIKEYLLAHLPRELKSTKC